MHYYPVFIDAHDRRCLIVGGGRVALRKASALDRAGARLTVISPVVDEGFKKLKEKPRILHRRVRRTDIRRRYSLVFAATSDPRINRRVCKRAHRLNIPVNAADHRECSSFILPSVVSRGPLQIAISTSGSSPAFARRMREEIEARYGEEYGILLECMEELRPEMLQRCEAKERRSLVERMASDEILEKIRRSLSEDDDRLLREAKTLMKRTIDEAC
jgi:precorrin-2 dehydrogenase/sirohydrochlorin ferrochelatase